MAETYPELRYADQPEVEVEIEIAAPPEAVFATIADIGLPARFSSEFKGASWIGDASRPKKGAQFSGRNFHPAAGEWETVCTVTEYDPPRVFEYCVQGLDGDVGTTWRYTVAPADENKSLLSQWMKMGPGRSFINVAIDSMPDKESRILNRRVHEHQANMEANLAGVKAMLES